MVTPSISILVLTRNERVDIERCLQSARRLSPIIHVVDSHSTDGTSEIARADGAVVHLGDFTSFAQKLNWAIDNIDFKTDWVMRLDADEVLSDHLVDALPRFLERQPELVSGINVRRRLWFMQRPIHFGGVYPRFSMRLWRPKKARCEMRELDEHMMLVEGTAATIKATIEDIPLITISQWIAKHNEYSSQEAVSAINHRIGDVSEQITPRLFGTKNERIRWIKSKLFYKIPLFMRPLLYYFYRYILMLGFLDGKSGLIFHFLHGFWYRFIVDTKIMEMQRSIHKSDN